MRRGAVGARSRSRAAPGCGQSAVGLRDAEPGRARRSPESPDRCDIAPLVACGACMRVHAYTYVCVHADRHADRDGHTSPTGVYACTLLGLNACTLMGLGPPHTLAACAPMGADGLAPRGPHAPVFP